jgi:hypothetical protein
MRIRRPRFTILTLLVVVAISAIGIDWFRPINSAEAERIAEAKFLSIPGASRWVGRYRVQAGYAGTFNTDQPKRYGDGWTVVVSDPKDGFPIMQMFLTCKGKTRAVDFAPGKFNELASSGLSADKP